MTYRPGDYYVICGKCGTRRYRSECRMDGYYTGTIVCSNTCYDPPRVFPKAPTDKQAVENARPDKSSANTTTTTSAAASKYAKSVTLTSTTGIYNLVSIGITLDNDDIQWTFATAAPALGVVAINEKLTDDVAKGNTVVIPDTSGETSVVSYTAAQRLAAI